MLTRRSLLLVSMAAAVPARQGWAQRIRSLNDPLRVGVDGALLDSGLAGALQRGFGRDTGIAVQLVRMPAAPLLQALDRGEMDAAMANAPDQEAPLEQQGLLHDRHAIASGEFVLVGPPATRKPGAIAPAAFAGTGAQTLQALFDVARAAPDALTFLSTGDGSGTHLAEQALWRRAQRAPVAPWYRVADPSTSLIAQARLLGAYCVVERGVWLAQASPALRVITAADPSMAEEVHLMRAFRVNHPAGKIFVAWSAGAKGRRIVSAQRAYRAVRG